MLEVVEAFLNQRIEMFLRGEHFTDVESQLELDNANRLEYLYDWETRKAADFFHVYNELSIKNIELLSETTREIRVHEKTWIEYTAEMLESAEIMAYGTDHVIVVEYNDVTEQWNVISDSFDERYLKDGYCSYDILQAEENQVTETVDESDLLLLDETTPEYSTYGLAISSYNKSAAINYANTWANSINSSVYSEEVNDCANFVSQCLYAGGIPFVNTGNYSSGWYYDFASKTGSLAWVRVSSFDSLWRGQDISRTTATHKTVLPGNPVYYLNSSGSSSGHLMFCVGHSGYIPILNAHNPFAYRLSIDDIETSNTLYTLRFVTPCSSHSYSFMTESYHFMNCSTCGMKYGEAHVYVGDSCKMCGYSLPAK